MRLCFPLVLVLAGCNAGPADDAIQTGNLAETAGGSTPLPAAGPTGEPEPYTPPALGEPGGLPDDRTPISEAPFTEDSAQGAANIVQTYYALIAEGKYAQAFRLWEPGAAGMTASAFAESFDRYSDYRANIGAPGRIEAGAGQRFVIVPVQVYGRLKEGARPFNMLGSLTLHRVEVDGATPDRRRWRIRSSAIKPTPGVAAPAPQPTENNRSTARYRCIDGSRLVANFDPDNDRVTVARGGKVLATLRGERSVSGSRYNANGFELRAKGNDMTFTAPGEPPIACAVIR
ncbi:MliC family protein [Sphingomonas sp. M1-B02]|uniref:MliC family protein n=1 Tax=Sphingomonas sp. M1-B02 TaxID=3114300 RepID=UPI0022403175|nr:MliC family protein [Sphingomonas sp. S6-11]UZK65606.1 MliC family protein [Sphingomonas sp. S6-11]